MILANVAAERPGKGAEDQAALSHSIHTTDLSGTTGVPGVLIVCRQSVWSQELLCATFLHGPVECLGRHPCTRICVDSLTTPAYQVPVWRLPSKSA